jgi:hypothetical protein
VRTIGAGVVVVTDAALPVAVVEAVMVSAASVEVPTTPDAVVATDTARLAPVLTFPPPVADVAAVTVRFASEATPTTPAALIATATARAVAVPERPASARLERDVIGVFGWDRPSCATAGLLRC